MDDMTDEEVYLYQKLMKCIENKQHGNTDENDIQRCLGALFHSWLKGGNNYKRKY